MLKIAPRHISALFLVAGLAAFAASWTMPARSEPSAQVSAQAPAVEQGIDGQVKANLCVKGTRHCVYSGVSNVFVVLTDDAGLYRQAASDDRGDFSFHVPYGHYYLSVFDGQGHRLKHTIPVDVPVGRALQVPLQLTATP
jgi:hypothetical protein